MNGTAIIVTGLPASGKSTLARHVAAELGLPFLDKDDFLEALYETNPVPDTETRRALSRRSDGLFMDAARNLPAAVLVSHWRNAACGPSSGTPTEWLFDAYDRVIELSCLCDVDEAARRFTARRRHPGHRDGDRDPGGVARWFAEYDSALPLGFGAVIEVDTNHDVDLAATVAAVNDQLRR